MNLKVPQSLIVLVVFKTVLLAETVMLTGFADVEVANAGACPHTGEAQACSLASAAPCCRAEKETKVSASRCEKACCQAMKETGTCPMANDAQACPNKASETCCPKMKNTKACSAEKNDRGCKAMQGAKLHNIGDIKDLRLAFNQAKGHPRLVLLFSPTCPVCVRGAGWVQKEILAKHPDPDLKVYAVWFSMYPGDARSKWQLALLPDRRVTHFWDENRVVGRFFATHNNAPPSRPVEWDAFFVYGPDASWDETPRPLCSFGRPVMRAREKLRASLAPLLELKQADFRASPATERTEVIARYEQMRCGMFIHFSMNTFMDPSEFGISSCGAPKGPLPPSQRYNPTNLDVDQWIATAKKAGMKYAVLTAKHWLGFALWDSKYTDYDVATSGNKTDVVAEFVKACRKYGIAPCFLYSFAQDMALRRDRGISEDEWYEHANNQIRELLTNYGPIAAMWFDGMGQEDYPQARVREAYETVKSVQPDCLVVMHDPSQVARWPTDVFQPGRNLPPPNGHDPKMEHNGKTYYIPRDVINTIPQTWFWSPDVKLMPMAELLNLYRDITSRGSNFTLGLGPDREGRLPADQVERLMELAGAIAGGT